MAYIGRTTDGFGVRQRFVFTPNAGTTSISGNDVSGATLTFSDSVYMDVFLNGVLLKAGTDYNTNTANTIAGLTATVANDEVTVLVYDIFTTADMVSATSGGTFKGDVVVKTDDGGLLTLQTSDISVTDGDVLGALQFQAPDEAGGTDSTTVSAAIVAEADSAFDAATNQTDLVFKLGSSEAATEKMRLTHEGNIELQNDLTLKSDSAVIQFGADSDVTLTHVADTALLLNSSRQLQFGDSGTYIHQSADGVLDLVSDTEIEINATTIDINGNADVSGTLTVAGNVELDGGDFVFNNSGAAKDFRIEGDTVANLFTVDGSEDDIGIGQDPSFTSGNGLHLGDNFKIGFGAGGNSRPDFQLGYNSSTDELELACGYGADTADLFLTTGGTLGFNLGGGSTCLKFEDADNSSYTVMTISNAVYNGGTNKIATFNTTKLSLDPSNSESLLLGTDGSLRLQHVYDDTTSNSANMYIHSDGTHQVMRSTSSERYKKDIETLEDKYADAVLGLRPVWYKSKCEADNPDHSHWGLIAEEVAKVDPRLVTFRYEITTSNNDQDTGETIIKTTKLDEPQAESVQYDRFVPHLINICKRQEDKITALEAEVKALKEA